MIPEWSLPSRAGSDFGSVEYPRLWSHGHLFLEIARCKYTAYAPRPTTKSIENVRTCRCLSSKVDVARLYAPIRPPPRYISPYSSNEFVIILWINVQTVSSLSSCTSDLVFDKHQQKFRSVATIIKDFDHITVLFLTLISSSSPIYLLHFAAAP